jgi:glycosyltransferase involved in cell wall biosynthesis
MTNVPDNRQINACIDEWTDLLFFGEARCRPFFILPQATSYYKVYPLLEPLILQDQFEIHLIGAGELSQSLDRRMCHVIRRGYKDLTDEFQSATALLAPTPIDLGSRTRIIDAFRHGTAVIAHAVNASGLPEIVRAAKLASKPVEFADAIIAFSTDPAIVEQHSNAGFQLFQNELDATVIGKKIVEFLTSISITRLAEGYDVRSASRGFRHC